MEYAETGCVMPDNAEGKTSVKQYLSFSETKVALMSLAHGINDMYAGFLSTFIPFIRENLGLSYALAGSFNVIVGIFHIICQPVIGFLSDRMRRPYLMIIGPILCGLGAVMIPNTNSYAAALFFAGLWGFGSALFHPQGTGGVGYVSSPERLRFNMTWFSMSGVIGAAISPFVAVAIVSTLGYRWLPVALIPTLFLAPLIYFSMPFLKNETVSGDHPGGLLKTIWSLFALLYPIWGIAAIRDLLYQCIRFFLPMKIAAQGGELVSVGAVVFLLTLGCSLGMIPMTKIAERYGSKRALKWSLFAGTCILLAAAYSGGLFSIALYVAGLSCIYSTISLTTTMAQILAPNDRSTASTIVLGLAWGVSNILVSPFGKLADLFGIDAAFIILALMPLLGLLLFLTPPLKALKE